MRTIPTERTELIALLDHAAALKRKVIEVMFEVRGVHRILGNLMQRGTVVADESELALAQDEFLYTFRDDDGRGVIDHVLEILDDELTPLEKEILEGWKGTFISVLRVESRDDLVFTVTNLVDELTYRMVANDTRESLLAQFKPGTCFFTRVAPLYDAMMLSGVQQPIPDEPIAYGMAAKLATQIPRLRLRNPEVREEVFALQRASYERWMATFGTAIRVGSPGEMLREQTEFLHQGIEEHARERGLEPRLPELRWPDRLMHLTSVGCLSDPLAGDVILPQFQRFMDALEDASRIDAPGPVRDCVVHYILDNDDPPYHLERIAEEYPEALDRLMQRLLNDPGFHFADHGEDFLRARYPDYDAHRVPAITPLSPKQLEGMRAFEAMSRQPRLSPPSSTSRNRDKRARKKKSRKRKKKKKKKKKKR